jgi:hypothetical protein
MQRCGAMQANPQQPIKTRKMGPYACGTRNHGSRGTAGEATPKEAEELHEEGIAFAPLPVLPDEFN